MKNFVLHNQTKILFGRQTLELIGPEARAFGQRALLVYGQHSLKSSGLLATIIENLAGQGLTVVEHGGVQPNPLLSHVRQGITLAKEEQIDVVVAAGGGSVLDSAKAICAGAKVNHDVWKFFTGKKSIKETLPLCTILTLAAAGSEMNGGMVLSHDDKKLKFGTGNKRLNPQVSILDPSLTCSVPANYTAYGAIDAIAHILEFYFTCAAPCPAVQARLMEGLVISIMESCDHVLAQLDDYNKRAELMWCCTMALNGWTACGLGLVGFPMHMIEHSLSALHNVAHGAGLAVILPAWMYYQARHEPQRFAQFSRRVMGCDLIDDQQAALQGITRLRTWFQEIGAPVSLPELGITRADIPALMQNSLQLAKVWRLKNYNEKIITEILTGCFP